MRTSVDFRDDIATSKPVSVMGCLWKHVTSFPLNPKLMTGTFTFARPKGSFVPRRLGDGAYAGIAGAGDLLKRSPKASGL